MIIKMLGERIIPLHLNYVAFIVQVNTPEFMIHYSKQKLYLKDYKCYVCGVENGLYLHHIIPICDCGKHRLKNICLLCSKHHRKVENHILDIPLQGELNIRLIRKTNKILRKYYMEYQETLIGVYPNEFIFKHLTKNKVIKEIIKYKPERLSETKERLSIKISNTSF